MANNWNLLSKGVRAHECMLKRVHVYQNKYMYGSSNTFNKA
jgi:hypothetical protein